MARSPTSENLSSEKERAFRPARHLIVLLDGTGVTASSVGLDARHSNIYKLNLALESHNSAFEAQIAFYIPGIGSSIDKAWIIKERVEQAFGIGLIGDVEQAYINICSNYFPSAPGSSADKIYLFGFSRGAVVARLVASLISRFGLLHADQLGRFADLWKVFMRLEPRSSLGDLLSVGVHKNVHIEFLGVFDTVMGKYSGTYAKALRKIFFGNTLLPLKVKRAVHLLALNETRNDFTCVRWRGLKSSSNSVLEQIWMPGVHTDVGGGYPEDFLSKVALLTMLERITEKTDLMIRPGLKIKLEEEIKSALENRVTPDITIHRETELLWTMRQTFAEGWRIPQADVQRCERLHPICRVLDKKLIKKNGSPEHHQYRFPECGVPDAEVMQFLVDFISGGTGGVEVNVGR